MKKVVVISDNHGQDSVLQRIQELEQDGDYFIHCGDSEASYQGFLKGYICVKGNNDWSLDLPNEAKLEIEGHFILITHGHQFSYFNREYAMQDILMRNNCDILMCGHTHIPMFVQEGKYTFINPGSTSLPRGGSLMGYAVVYIDNEYVRCEFKQMR